MKEYYLCSKEVIDAFPDVEKSKPFNSGYEFDKDMYYVAVLDFSEVERYYNRLPENKQDNFWCRECVENTINISTVTKRACKIKGLFAEIECKTGLTTIRNRAMAIYGLAKKYNCSPIEFINSIC